MEAAVIAGDEHLAWLHARRSVRAFSPKPVAREAVQRLIEAAHTAPSNGNRQPWRYVVAHSPEVRAAIVDDVRSATEHLAAQVAVSRHADEFASYAAHFWGALTTAAAIIVPCVRTLPETLDNLLRSAGVDPTGVPLPRDMPMEVCATAAGVMALLLQAQADGLAACWMAGPMVAAPSISRRLGISPPFAMLGAIAVGYPAEGLAAEAPARKPLETIVTYH